MKPIATINYTDKSGQEKRWDADSGPWKGREDEEDAVDEDEAGSAV